MKRRALLGAVFALLGTAAPAATVTTTVVLDPVAARSFVNQGAGYQLSDYAPNSLAVGYANDTRTPPFLGLPDHSGLYAGVMEFAIGGVPRFDATITSAHLVMRWPGGLPPLNVTDYFGDGVVEASDTGLSFIAYATAGVPDFLVLDVTDRFRSFRGIGATWYGVLLQHAAPDYGCRQGTLCLSNIGGDAGPTPGDPFARQPDLVVTYQQTIPDPPPLVPEPGVWALLVTGFGAVGAALRRRKLAPA